MQNFPPPVSSMGCHVPPRPWTLSTHPAFDVPMVGDWCVVACFFNPAGYRRPVANLGAFLDFLYAERIPVFMAELSFHDSLPHLPLWHDRVWHYRMGDEGIMFAKEALMNAVWPRLPAGVSKVFFVDADVVLAQGRPAFVAAAAEMEAGAALVQPFSQAVWCDAAGRRGQPRLSTGWAWDHAEDRVSVVDPGRYHPGFAYGLRVDALKAIGGLYGCPITGTGDAALFQAALAPDLPPPILGRSHYSAPAPEAWRARVAEVIGEAGVSHVLGPAVHFYHGSQGRRAYDQRHHLLAAFRPSRDLVTAPNGLPAWAPGGNPALRDAVKRYFFSRAEDE